MTDAYADTDDLRELLIRAENAFVANAPLVLAWVPLSGATYPALGFEPRTEGNKRAWGFVVRRSLAQHVSLGSLSRDERIAVAGALPKLFDEVQREAARMQSATIKAIANVQDFLRRFEAGAPPPAGPFR